MSWDDEFKELINASVEAIQKPNKTSNPDITDHRYKAILKAEEASKYCELDGLEYDARGCDIPEHHKLHKKIFSIKEAKKLKFGSDCGCTLYSYMKSWGVELPEYSEPIEKKRARIKKGYEEYFLKSDLASLNKLEALYKQDLQWHWAEFRDFAEQLSKAGDYQRALSWMNASINGRIVQMGKEPAPSPYDSSLASLYTAKGIICMKMPDYLSALREFLIAIVQYNYQPTKTLLAKINTSLKKSGIPQNVFDSIIEYTKINGLIKGLEKFNGLFKEEG